MSIDNNASRPQQPLAKAAPLAARPVAATRPATASQRVTAAQPGTAAQRQTAAHAAAQNQAASGEEEEEVNPRKQVLWQSFLASQASLLVHTVILIILGTMNFAEPEFHDPPGNVVMETPEKPPVIEPVKEDPVEDIAKEIPPEAPAIKDLPTGNAQGGSGPLSDIAGFGGDGELGDISANDGDKLAGPVLASGRVNPNVSDAAFSSTGIPTLPRSGEGGMGRRTSGVPKGGTTFFNRQVTGNRFVFVIDNSGSMDGGRFEMAAKELLKAVGQLKDTDLFYVIFFSGDAFPLFHPEPANRLVPATAKNKKRFEEWLNNAPLGNSTRGEKALARAFELKPDNILLLGDGEFTDKASDITVNNADKYKEENPNIKVNTLGFNMKGRGRDSFIAIAQAFEGVFTDVKVEPAMVDLSQKKKRTRTDNWPPAPPDNSLIK